MSSDLVSASDIPDRMSYSDAFHAMEVNPDNASAVASHHAAVLACSEDVQYRGAVGNLYSGVNKKDGTPMTSVEVAGMISDLQSMIQIQTSRLMEMLESNKRVQGDFETMSGISFRLLDHLGGRFEFKASETLPDLEDRGIAIKTTPNEDNTDGTVVIEFTCRERESVKDNPDSEGCCGGDCHES